MRASFSKNWLHYLEEALGLALFMASACFFGALLQSDRFPIRRALPGDFERSVLMGLLMGLSALGIFYAPFTAPSGSHINPAVTLSFLRLGQMDGWDALFYILFQFAGGLAAVYAMGWAMGPSLTAPPVQYVVTVPGRMGPWPAATAELVISFLMMTTVLFASAARKWKKFSRPLSAFLVCLFVVVAGPISGFGMNPARSLASALPAHIYTSFWIYLLIPLVGMLLAAEGFLHWRRPEDQGSTNMGSAGPVG